MSDNTHEWNEAFARLTRKEQAQIRDDQRLFGRAAIYVSPDGERTIRVKPDAIVDQRDMIWNKQEPPK